VIEDRSAIDPDILSHQIEIGGAEMALDEIGRIDPNHGQPIEIELPTMIRLHLDAGRMARMAAWPDPDVHRQAGRASSNVDHQERLVLDLGFGAHSPLSSISRMAISTLTVR
jgi:hypothetical protein